MQVPSYRLFKEKITELQNSANGKYNSGETVGRAYRDGSGNNIASTYATKSYVDAVIEANKPLSGTIRFNSTHNGYPSIGKLKRWGNTRYPTLYDTYGGTETKSVSEISAGGVKIQLPTNVGVYSKSGLNTKTYDGGYDAYAPIEIESDITCFLQGGNGTIDIECSLLTRKVNQISPGTQHVILTITNGSLTGIRLTNIATAIETDPRYLPGVGITKIFGVTVS